MMKEEEEEKDFFLVLLSGREGTSWAVFVRCSSGLGWVYLLSSFSL